MPRVRPLQTAFTSGELDPKLRSRTEIKFYYQGLEKARNVQLIPQGGAKRRPGLEYVDVVVPQIEILDLTGLATAPNGGTAANAVDNDPDTELTTTAGVGTTNPFVIVHIDLGAATEVLFADVRGLRIDGGSATSDEEVVIQYSTDDASWTDLGEPIDSVGTDDVTRRRTGPITARYWRVARVGTTDLSTQDFVLDEFWLWAPQTGVLSETRLVDFSFSTTQTYMMLASDRNLAVYLDGAWQVDIYIPHTSAQIGQMNWVQSLDTLILFHANVQPHEIMRQGAHDEWQDANIVFADIPKYEFTETDVNPAHTLTPSATDGFVKLTAGGAYWTAATDVGTYVEANSGRARITRVDSTTVAYATVIIPFFDTSAAGSGTWTHETGWEASMSDTRGWPRCGVFHGGRLWMGGSAQLPHYFWGSQVGQFFDLDLGQGLDDEGIFRGLDSDSVSAIYNMNSGRHLQIFTAEDEWYIIPNDSPIKPDTIEAIRTTNAGSAGPGLRVFNIEGAVMFVQKRDEDDTSAGDVVREFLYTDIEQAYDAGNITLLSSHLLVAPLDAVARRSTKTDRGNQLFVVNNDGSLAVLQTLRKQEITGWSLWHTDGTIKSVGVDAGTVFAVVERTITGVGTVNYLERFNESLYTDCGVLLTTADGLPATVIAALDHLGTEVVATRADGAVLSDETVASNQITLDREAETTCEVGLHFPDEKEWEVTRLQAEGLTEAEAREAVYKDSAGTGNGDEVWVRDMPIAPQLPDGSSLAGEYKGVVTVVLPLYQTIGLWVSANDEDAEEVTFRKFGSDLLDNPPPLFTGEKRIEGLSGYTETGQVELTQREPVPMLVLGIAKEVDL